jgi:hypothetical protein
MGKNWQFFGLAVYACSLKRYWLFWRGLFPKALDASHFALSKVLSLNPTGFSVAYKK